MPIVKQKSKRVHAWSGDDWYTYSSTISFAPSNAHAQVCLSQISGEGTIATGITRIRHRPDPDGAEVEKSFSDLYWEMPNIVGVIERLTSVTWVVTMASDNSASARIDIYFWG